MGTVCKVGKAKVRIEVEGCIKCGMLWAAGWRVARKLPVTIGKKRYSLNVSICNACDNEPQPAMRTG